MDSNTGHKYISHTDKGYVVSLPAEIALKSGGQQRIQRKRLPDAIYQRNMAFGYDPDQGTPTDFVPLKMEPAGDKLVRIAALGDTHLCSHYEALEELHQFYQEIHEAGVRVVFHAANWVDGDKFSSDIHTWGMHNQIAYFLRNYPQVEGITTYILDGDDHEGWWYHYSGVLPGEVLEATAPKYGRNDLKYLGYMERDVVIPVSGQPARVKIIHGGGGSSKSVSLASQNIIDGAMTNSETPDVMIVGHYHKAHFLPNYRGCYAIQVGTFEWQTPFMRKKNLHAHIGGWILELSRNGEGRLRVGARYLSYKPRPWKHSPLSISLTNE